jgi:hypothetical protein
VVEYPIKSRLEMPDSCGPLVKVPSSQLILPIGFSALMDTSCQY